MTSEQPSETCGVMLHEHSNFDMLREVRDALKTGGSPFLIGPDCPGPIRRVSFETQSPPETVTTKERNYVPIRDLATR